MKYKAVFFDLDNTLYSYDRAHSAAYSAMLELASRSLSISTERLEALHAEASAVLKERCGGGSAIHNRLIRYQILLELAGLPIAHALPLAQRYWQVFLDRLEPEPGAFSALRRLKAMGLRLGVGTNMTADLQFEKLRRLGFLGELDCLVTSEEVNAEKPDRRLFDLCAAKAGAEPGACCFVGDSLKNDACAARDAGMQGIWYCPDRSRPPADGIPTLRALSELPDMLAGSGGSI